MGKREPQKIGLYILRGIYTLDEKSLQIKVIKHTKRLLGGTVFQGERIADLGGERRIIKKHRNIGFQEGGRTRPRSPWLAREERGLKLGRPKRRKKLLYGEVTLEWRKKGELKKKWFFFLLGGERYLFAGAFGLVPRRVQGKNLSTERIPREDGRSDLRRKG